MRIIHADISIRYSGRGDTYAPISARIIMYKDDGAVLIHSPTGTKPLNYMGGHTAGRTVCTDTIEDGIPVMIFENNKDVLRIYLHHVHADTTYDFDGVIEPGLQRDNTEDVLQVRIAADPTLVGLPAGIDLVREWDTGDGPIDLAYVDQSERTIYLIEVKRTAQGKDIDQVTRYVRAVEDNPQYAGYQIIPFLAARDIRPKALDKCAKRGVTPISLGK